MNFEYQLNEDDFVDAQHAHLRRALSQTNKAATVVFSVILLLAIIVCVSWTFDWPRRPDRQLWPFVVVCASGVLASVSWAFYLWSGIPYRRQFRKIKALQAPMKMRTTDDDVHYSTGSGEGRVSWSAFEDWRESKKSFLLYPQPNLFYIVPKRVVAPDQIATLRDLLRSRIAKTL